MRLLGMTVAATSVARSGAAIGTYHVMKRMLVGVLVYNVVCVFVFSILYGMIGFSKNFNMPASVDDTYRTRLYYSFATQATCMAGEIYPVTPAAHVVLSMQIAAAWLQVLLFVVPWIPKRR